MCIHIWPAFSAITIQKHINLILFMLMSWAIHFTNGIQSHKIINFQYSSEKTDSNKKHGKYEALI